MSKVDEKFEIELNAMKYNVHANSPYNDGWTQDHYRKLYEEELKKIKTLRKIIIISCKPKAAERDIKFIKEELKEFNLYLTNIYNLETTRQRLQIYIFKNT